MRFSTVYSCLDWMASLHPVEMELGLDRVKTVAARLNLLTPDCRVFVVGGTNGKGSTVAGLEAIYRAAGYHVGAFTSPFLFKHNEQIRINGIEVSDEACCRAYEQVADALLDTTLTPFELTTLAALLIFKNNPLDVLILEVGLGGRLDAVNMIDADISIVTSIDIDHVEWLGNTRDKIAHEKAGIFRLDKPAICGDPNPPQTLINDAKKIGAKFICQKKDFHYEEKEDYWNWSHQQISYPDLPRARLNTQNMSTVLMAITAMQSLLPVNREAIDHGLRSINLPGRIQIEKSDIIEIRDVSHNPASVALLAKQLRLLNNQGKIFAVFSMLADKDINESVKIMKNEIDYWYISPLSCKRAASEATLLQALHEQNVTLFDSIKNAYQQAKNKAKPGDCIVVFGSFHTVAEVFGHTK